jgi:predicted ATP-dependent endonuclease of OLD family
VILIDEAETHLHYDAQADLVGVFEEQQEAAKIIYTTHSAGCLPRDIGLGLRAIVPIETETDDGQPQMTDHSRIINEFWFGEHGFTPMLIAMGASALAFSAAQKALVTEGFTDALLLPTLLREAAGLSQLEYQVVPHFARARPEEIPNFDLLAARVIYLVDGDQGGRDHIAKLTDAGVLREQILVLGGDRSDLTLEDLIDPEVLASVVSASFADQGSEIELPLEAIPSTRRMHTLAEWCEAQSTPQEKITLPTKETLAREFLARRRDGLVDPEKREVLEKLDGEVREVLETATAHLKSRLPANR